MEGQSLNNYPKNREWNEKVFSMPKIPRGTKGQPTILREILMAIQDGESPRAVLSFEGSDSKADLERHCTWLRPIGLVDKKDGKWSVTEIGQLWLKNNDILYLTALLCSTIKFFGEILFFLEEPKKMDELFDIAIEQYRLNWKTKSEVNNRLCWLRELGMVDFQDYLLEYSVTEKGREFLKSIDITLPEEIVIESDTTVNEELVTVENWAIELCELEQKDFKERKNYIGYIPGNVINSTETISGYLQLLSIESAQDAIRDYSKKLYDISNASSNMFLSTLVNTNFVERKSKNTYKIGILGEKWLETEGVLELLCCLHAKFLFVFEILNELVNQNLSVRELTVIAKVSYGFNRESVE